MQGAAMIRAGSEDSGSHRVRGLWRFVVLLVTAVAFFGAASFAEAQARDADDLAEDGERRRWSSSAVVARAQQASPAVRIAHAERERARAHTSYAGMPVIGNPYIGLRALFGVPDASAATYAATIALPFELSGRQGRWSAEVDQLLEEADQRLLAAENDASAEALDAYVALATAQSSVALADERVRVSEALLESTRLRVDAADAIALDLALAEADRGQAQADRFERRRALIDAQAALRAVLDLDPDVAPEVEPVAGPGPPGLPALSRAIARATERRAEPRAHAAAARRYRFSEDRLFAESVDSLLVGLEWESQGNQQTAHTFGVSAAMSLPLVRTAQGDRAVARAESQLADEQASIAERMVEREVVRAHAVLENALAQHRELDDVAVPAAERALSMTEELLAAGSIDLFRVLTARRALFELRQLELDALGRAWLAHVALERAMGGAE